MDNKYFPHAAGGELNPTDTFVSRFNFQPNSAIALDSRSVITEWSKDALVTMLPSEVYVGLSLFCLDDKILRICAWLPTEVGTNYTGYNCLWKEIYDVDANNEWIDVKTYQPEKTLTQKIEEAESTKWKFVTKPDEGYWGFYQYLTEDIKREIDENINNICNVLVAGSINKNVLSGVISKFSIKSDYAAIKAADNKTSESYDNAQGKMLTMMIPQEPNRSIDYIVFQSMYVDEPDMTVSEQSLQYLSKATTYEFNDVMYDVYVCVSPKMETTENLVFNIFFHDKN